MERRAWRCTCLLLPGVTEFTSAVLQGEQVAGEGGGLGTRFEGCRNRSRMSKKKSERMGGARGEAVWGAGGEGDKEHNVAPALSSTGSSSGRRPN